MHNEKRIDAAITRHNEIMTRIMMLLSKSAAEGCDLRRAGAFKVFVSSKISRELFDGLRAREARDGRYHPPQITYQVPQIGIVGGLDLCVDDTLLVDQIVLRYEVDG